MALDANLFVFVQPTGSTYISKDTQRLNSAVYYFSDIAPEKIFCKQEELIDSLKRDYQFTRDMVDEFSRSLNVGVSVIVDLEAKTFYETEEGLLINQGAVRNGRVDGRNSIEKINKMLERGEGLIKKNFFT